jgi:flagellar biogenesis protein FliO
LSAYIHPDPKRQKEPRKTTEETSGCEIGTGQKVAQLFDSFMMIMMIVMVVVIVMMMMMKNLHLCLR